MSVSLDVAKLRESSRLSLQTLMAFTACCAVLVVLWKWVMTFPNPGSGHVAAFLSPWTVGVFLGIARSLHRKRSTLWGAITGGCVGAAISPILPGIYLLVRGMNAVSVSTVAPQILAAILGSLVMGLVFSGVQRACSACASYLDSQRTPLKTAE